MMFGRWRWPFVARCIDRFTMHQSSLCRPPAATGGAFAVVASAKPVQGVGSKSNPQQLRLIFPDTPLHFRAVGLAQLARTSRQMAKHPLETNRHQRLADAASYESEVRAIADQALNPCAS